MTEAERQDELEALRLEILIADDGRCLRCLGSGTDPGPDFPEGWHAGYVPVACRECNGHGNLNDNDYRSYCDEYDGP